MIKLQHFQSVSPTLSNIVSIANSSPAQFQIKRIDVLCPGQLVWDLKNGKITHQKYIQLYWNLLFVLGSGNYNFNLLNDLTLLCWEKPGDFCHRRILAMYLTQHTSHEIYLDGNRIWDVNQIGYGRY